MFRGGSSATQNQSRQNTTAKKQDFTPAKKTKSVIKDDVGEYVDYEELDEDEK